MLGERVTWRRWAAILVGFGGVLVGMVRPSTSAFQAAALVALLATFFSVLRDLVTRRISSVETPNLILFDSMVAAAVAGAVSPLSSCPGAYPMRRILGFSPSTLP